MSRVVIVLSILAIMVWIFFPRPGNPFSRQTYIIVSDPMVVFSWNGVDRTLTLISFPSDIAAEGTHGYGTYALSAFWRLGEIDKKDGTVLAESVSEALGIPIDGYIGSQTGKYISHSVFSIKNIFGFVRGAYRTNISLGTFIRLAWMVDMSRPARVKLYDFTHNAPAVARDTTLPDGSSVRILDPQRLDAVLAAVFEDETVRRESVTAAVYNTTDMPSLGNRVGRLLTNLGVSVVVVGNDTPEVEKCSVSGSPTALRSKSAQVIVAVFGCTSVVGEATRADLILRVGAATAKRFRPN